MLALKVLTPAQVEQFMERGWVQVEEAYPKEAALEVQQFLWRKLEERSQARQNDPSTWMEPMIRLNEAYSTPEFQRCNSRKLADAIEDIIGKGRWVDRSVYGETEHQSSFGWWPVNFALDADRPWDVPVKGWHWDGIHFRHFIDSPEQGLLCLCLFSEIGPQGGGTVIAEGSHKVVAKFLERHPEGLELGEAGRLLSRSHPWLSELMSSSMSQSDKRIEKFMNQVYEDSDGFQLRVVETTGSPGDVILCHPFLYHAPSPNHSGIPRFMCNRTTPLKEKMNLRRADPSDYSPLEISIRIALGYRD
ncbi:hypothetical protein B1748_04925 [Paenibacillus sp. MY03]|uniref:hypothetical protein n=1 Tax=Paenibacillus sp. MY03 TaxID=302980 RepID=UPI000B3D16E5|nr:hypothetical protein [Paenibacillus sp. MY03]OUS78109.1 hypothetical protein B1748_04925 [Paenibacillus sp. MY03]